MRPGVVPILHRVSEDPPDPRFAPQTLERLSDKELLERVAEAMSGIMHVSPEKKIAAISPKIDPTAHNNLAYAWSFGLARGYSPMQLGMAWKEISTSQGMWLRMHEKLGRPKNWRPPGSTDWKEFERVVAKIHEAYGGEYEVQTNERVVDRETGEPRELDVTLRFKRGPYPFLVVIECKNYRTKIDAPKIEAFVTKLRDVGAHLGVMVSAKGFTKPAITKAHKNNIQVYTLERAESLDWSTVRQKLEVSIPFPIEFTITPMILLPKVPAFAIQEALITHHGEMKTLPALIAEISAGLLRDRALLPRRVRIRFKSDTFLEVPPRQVRMEIREIDSLFVQFSKIVGVDLAAPAARAVYIYRNALTGEPKTFEIEEEKFTAK